VVACWRRVFGLPALLRNCEDSQQAQGGDPGRHWSRDFVCLIASLFIAVSLFQMLMNEW
jgi:hypothetical protein